MKTGNGHLLVVLLWALIVAFIAARTYIMFVLDPVLALAWPVSLQVVFGLPYLAPAVVGTIVAWRRPGNPIGWLFMMVSVMYAFFILAGVYASYAFRAGASEAAVAAWVASWIFPIIVSPIPFVTLLFPGGIALSRRWQWVGWGMLAAIIASVLSLALSPVLYNHFAGPIPTGIENPMGIRGGQAVFDAMRALSWAAFGALWAAAGVSQVLRYRHGTVEDRLQLKWFMVGSLYAAVLSGPFLILQSAGLVGPPRYLPLQLALTMGWALMAIGTGVAILKYRLYDIDVIINRSLVYGLLSTFLIGVYSAIIGITQSLVVPRIDDSTAIVLFVGTTVMMGVILTPVKDRLQVIVDRHFVEVDDPAKELQSLSDRMRSILRVIDARMISRDGIARQLLEDIVVAFRAESGAAQLEEGGRFVLLHTVGAAAEGAARFDVPLEHDGREYGLISLGRRLNGRPYTAHDREAIQAAATVVEQTLDQGSVASPPPAIAAVPR